MAPETTPTSSPTAAATNSMAGHVKAVAIIDLVFGVLTALAAFGVIFAFGVGSAAVDANERYGAPDWVADMLATMAFVFGALFAAVAVLYIVAGIRLMSFRRSGKGLGIASAVVQIVVGLPTLFGAGVGIVPLAAGIYALVILTRDDTDRLLVNE